MYKCVKYIIQNYENMSFNKLKWSFHAKQLADYSSTVVYTP